MDLQIALLLIFDLAVLIAFVIFLRVLITRIINGRKNPETEAQKPLKLLWIWGILFASIVLFCIGSISTFRYYKNNHSSQQPEENFTYYKFRLPFALDSEQTSNSLMNQKAIKITDVKNSWVEFIDASAKNDGWTKINESYFTDGGSSSISYFLDKDNPAVEIFYKWDMSKGSYQYISIQFIHPANLGSWLIKQRSDKAIRGENLDVEKLMDCDGVIAKTVNDATECIKK